MWTTDVIVLLVLLFLVGIALVYAIVEKRLQNKFNDKLDKMGKEYEAKRKKSNDIARNVLRGQLLEQFAPIKTAELEDLNLFDFRFLGDFADYIVLDGYTDVKDGIATEVKRVIFLEIKSGDAKTSLHQDAVIDAILNGRVEHRIIKVPANPKDWDV